MLCVWTNQSNQVQQQVLEQRGYTKLDKQDSIADLHRYDLSQQVPEYPPADGYRVRSLGEIDELPARSWASWRSFHPDDPDEKFEGWD